MTTRREWQREADRLAGPAVAAGTPAAWFEPLWASARAGEVTMPWDRSDPHPVLASWAPAAAPPHPGARAVVVGCGLGADAAHLARQGWRTTSFDISPTAVELAGRRFAGLGVDWQVADLLALPADLPAAFDLVVDIYTVQALPRSVRAAATAAVRSLLAPGGVLLAVHAGLDRAPAGDPAGDGALDGPPWPLTRDEMAAFASGDVTATEIVPAAGWWRGEFRRAAGSPLSPPAPPDAGRQDLPGTGPG
ncbi:class I SAM-dependent methyltransferase [Nakamurella endophytica]|uniref:Methyltransferase domain-containing protein n=1 Tax=Nakamurella endophytica TaxID=1748367 RepID=A0A917T4M3_9ACTN|nr:class I SAM-dependent methyltransferase [Nakamurella endophytica]GGM09041.1 hypothetical protein GCM10011594_31190 [Nakamurella endophytica]